MYNDLLRYLKIDFKIIILWLGIWIWSSPLRISDDTVMIILDTEGLNSTQRDSTIDAKIFSLTILLSSMFIYN